MRLVGVVVGPLASFGMTSGMTRRTTVKTAIGVTGALAWGVPALSGTAAASGTSDESETAERQAELPNPVLHYRAPAADWERESLPIGGGALGASVHGTLASELLTLNEKTLWTGGPGSAQGYDFGNWTAPRPGALAGVRERLDREGSLGPDAVAAELGQPRRGYGAYQVFGELHLDVPDAPAAPDASYRRALDLRTALASVAYTHEGVAHSREFFVSHPGSVIAGRLTADSPGHVAFTLRYTSPRSDFTASAAGDRLTVRGALQDNGLRFEAQIRVRTSGGEVTAGADGSLTVTGADHAWFYLAAGTDYADTYPAYRGEDPHRKVAAAVDTAAAASYEERARRPRERPPHPLRPRRPRHRPGPPRPAHRPVAELLHRIGERGGPVPGGALLPVRPLPAHRLLTGRLAARQSPGRVEQRHQPALVRRLPHQHQPPDELLARRGHQPGRDHRTLRPLRRGDA